MDLRIPSGCFFLILGLVLMSMGLFVPSAKAPLALVNVNLYAGLVMAIFGSVMLWLAKQRS